MRFLKLVLNGIENPRCHNTNPLYRIGQFWIRDIGMMDEPDNVNHQPIPRAYNRPTGKTLNDEVRYTFHFQEFTIGC